MCKYLSVTTRTGNSPYNRRLANAQSGNKAASINSTQVALCSADHEDGDTDSPDHAEEAGSPDTSDAIADHESAVATVSTTYPSSWVCKTYISAPPTDPIWTMAATLAFRSAWSFSL